VKRKKGWSRKLSVKKWASGQLKLPEYSGGDVSFLLNVRNDFWDGRAVWERKDGIWTCADVSIPELRWMRKTDPAAAKLEMARLGCEWFWI
jgi:hypothetical protein